MSSSLILINNDDGIREFRKFGYGNNLKLSKFESCYNFNIQDGNVFLTGFDQSYILDLIPHKCDIVLPKNPLPMNYVILTQNYNILATDFSFDNFQKLKIYGNKKRIMGLDECLICDVPFASLKLTFFDDQRGWVIC